MIKKTIIFLIPVLLLAVIFCACATKPPIVNTDWAGEYSGTIPAADCPGINVSFTVNADFTYLLIYDYIEREGSFTETGNFHLNEAGDTIILPHRDSPQYYRIGDNSLLQLDTEGNVITGNFAEMYILKKK